MKNNFSYLNDTTFLKILFNRKVKNHYAKITLLDFQTENFYKDFTGRVTAGTVTLSASSAVRRTCSLTIIAEEEENDLTNIDGEISINRKFQLLVGYENDIVGYEKYGDIIWFPLGIFIFTGVSISRTTNGCTITVTGKDKMCLLNGEIMGEIYATTSFHEAYTQKEDGSIEISYPTIFQIIQEAVNHLGGEDLNNIVINDLPTQIKQAIQYNGNQKLYYGINEDNSYIFTLDKSIFSTNLNLYPKLITTYKKGDIIGYKYVDFTYPGELVLSAGSNVANLLQNIINKIGNYEYFYNKDGIFYFQEIKNYLNTSYVPLIEIDNNNYTTNFAESTKSVYSFDESELILSYSNTPNYTNIKNDFWVWGTNEEEQPICFHLVIDDKPALKEHKIVFYKKNNKVLIKPYYDGYELQEGEIKKDNYKPNDWRCELYIEGLENSILGLKNNDYYAELVNYFPDLYDFENNKFYDEIILNPSSINYWLDFITSDSLVGKFSVKNIGRRTKAVTKNDINILYNREIPDIIVLNKTSEESNLIDQYNYSKTKLNFIRKGQKFVEVEEDLYNNFSVATIQNSAYDYARELLQQYTYYNETVTLTSLPVFYLEPNTRITINNKKSGIEGDFIIQTLNIPLAANGQMTLTASKATSKL